MSAFSVKPSALRTYAGTVSGAGGHGGLDLTTFYINNAPPYVDKYVHIDTSQMSDLFQHILSSNKKLVADLHTTYDTLWPNLSQSGLALAGSADKYDTTDKSVNAKVDNAWPGHGKVVTLNDEAGDGTVDDNPAAPLDEVPESEVEIPDPVHWIMDDAGWLSIGSDVLKVASMFGFDPGSLLAKALAGDYSMVARAGNAAKALAEFERNTASDLSSGLSTMTKSWTGNAANDATSYFRTWANAFDAHADQLDTVSNKYAQIAQAIAQIGVLFSSLLSVVIDQFIKCVTALAAASCLSEVPVLGQVIDIIGAYEVFMTKEAVDKFVKASTAVTDTCEAVIGLALGIAGACEPGTASTDFPKAAYANGAQK